MGVDLDQGRRSILHTAVHGLLREVATNLDSSFQLEELIEDVFSVVHGACAEFSETWNGQHARVLGRRLPVEVMTECLRLADFQTRVRASHVSRRWRAVALADCRLWTNIRIAPFPGLEDLETVCYRIEHLMRRSRPLPARLLLPHIYSGDYEAHTSRIFSALRSDLHRLEEYVGPASVFRQETSLPALIACTVLDLAQDDRLVMKNTFAARNVPKLRRLVAPILHVPAGSQPYLSLQHLVCRLPRDAMSECLFRCCPSLITVEFRGLCDDTVLPPGPLPLTLQHVTLCVSDSVHSTSNFDAMLQPWSDARIPHLSLYSSESMEPLIAIFLSSHDQPVKLITNDDDYEIDIIMTTEPAGGDFRWEIRTDCFWESSESLSEFGVLFSERLTSLSVVLMHFWNLCFVQAEAPRLMELEIRLAGHLQVDSPDDHDIFYVFQAPQLRRLSLDIANSFRDVTNIAYDTTIFDTLDKDFRSLLVYDAELLDCIAVRCAARHLEDFSRHDFSRFAKMYCLDTQ